MSSVHSLLKLFDSNFTEITLNLITLCVISWLFPAQGSEGSREKNGLRNLDESTNYG